MFALPAARLSSHSTTAVSRRSRSNFAGLAKTLHAELDGMQAAGTYKRERVITSPQQASIRVSTAAQPVLNFCANNYLGLCNDQRLVDAAVRATQSHGLGMGSVRFICGTQDIHKTLEQDIASFHRKDDTILYGSCFDANGGLFEALLGPDDAVLSDALNHASIIDGVRLCKAQKHRYAHADMADLEAKLQASQGARNRLIITDAVFSMDGVIAPLDKICDLAERYNAVVAVDECHGTGLMGADGVGGVDYRGVLDRVDIINSTLGKAIGGATGGFTTGRKEVIDVLRQRSRPYLFSNSVAPAVVGAGIEVMKMLREPAGYALRSQLHANASLFRAEMSRAGFKLIGADHAIVPVMLGDAKLASDMADALLQRGIFVIGFSYPVVPKDQARIRVQLSAAHSTQQVQFAVEQFVAVGKKFNVI